MTSVAWQRGRSFGTGGGARVPSQIPPRLAGEARRPSSSSAWWLKPHHLHPYIPESFDCGITVSKVKRASASCLMCLCGSGSGCSVGVGNGTGRWSQVSTRRVNPTLLARREISASTAAKRGAVLRGKFPLLWGTMRSTFGARSPSSHTLNWNLLAGDTTGWTSPRPSGNLLGRGSTQRTEGHPSPPSLTSHAPVRAGLRVWRN